MWLSGALLRVSANLGAVGIIWELNCSHSYGMKLSLSSISRLLCCQQAGFSQQGAWIPREAFQEQEFQGKRGRNFWIT